MRGVPHRPPDRARETWKHGGSRSCPATKWWGPWPRVGDGVTEPEVGRRRVGIAWIAGTCGTCRFCVTGRENLCEQISFTGWDRDGGYADLVVAGADFVYPLPGGADPVDLAPLLCGGVIGYRSLRVAGVNRGQRLGLYGFGASATVRRSRSRATGDARFTWLPGRSTSRLEHGISERAWAGPYDERPPVDLDAAITFAPVGEVVVERAAVALDRGGTVAINAIHLDRIPELPYEQLWWERAVRSVANVTRRRREGAAGPRRGDPHRNRGRGASVGSREPGSRSGGLRRGVRRGGAADLGGT